MWPVVTGGSSRWASFSTLYAWPEVRTKQLTPTRLALVANAHILSDTLGETRLARVRALASAVSLPLAPSAETLCGWAEAVAEHLVEKSRQTRGRWRDFYDDIVALFSAASVSPASLVVKR